MTALRPTIELLIADVDGTLVNPDKVLTERARRAVLNLHEAGIRFSITSGRPPRGMSMLIDPLKLRDPIAGFNGGLYVRPDLSIIESYTLDRRTAERTLELMQEHGLDAWLYSGNDWLIRDPKAPHVEREARTVRFEPVVVSDFSDRLDGAAKIVGVSDDFERVTRAEAEAQKELGDHASATRSQPYYLDVTHPSANKGCVVEFLSKHLKIDPKAIATIGDMPNDVLMFRKSGFSIAMGNAAPEVQRQATVVTDSYEDEGFAKAVERFLLAKPT
jgi:Cof subfamily protein (haloacid dehalogenase superfamily)